MDDVVSTVEPFEEDGGSTSQKPVPLEETEELLPGIKEEETDRLVIRGGRVVSETETRISGILEGLFVKPESEHPPIHGSITYHEEESNSSGLECSVCMEKLPNDRALTEHMRIHTGERYICKVCDESFISLEQLHRHRFSKHTEKRSDIECPVCQKTFACMQNLKQHKLLHSEDRPFSCDQCDMSFVAKNRLSQHQKTVHLRDPALLECPICHKELSSSQTLKAHMRRHDENRPRPFVCEECGVSFTTNASLQRHTLIHTGERPFDCDECGNVYRTKCDLKQHKKRKHSEANTTSGEGNASEETTQDSIFDLIVKPEPSTSSESKDTSSKFMCDVCQRPMASQRNLTNHMRTHTGERPFSCDDCGASFTSNDRLLRHRKSQHPSQPRHRFNCTLCDKDFSEAKTLKYHMLTHSGERPYSCDDCDATFVSLEAKRIHYKRRHLKNPVRVECIICHKEFSPRRLEAHMRMHTGERPYSCTDCDVHFPSEQSYKRHMTTQGHLERGSATCAFCQETFPSKQRLKQHMTEAHSGDDQSTCGECGKVLSSREGLRLHQMIHTGERPFTCEECENAFRDYKTLKTHKMRRHKGEKPHVCGECGHGFVTKWDLKKHLQRIHPHSMILEQAEGDGVVQEDSEKSMEAGTSGETTQDSPFESDLKLYSKPYPNTSNDYVTEKKTVRPEEYEKSLDFESTSRVPNLNVLEEALPEVKKEESDRLVMFGGHMDYEEEAWSSGVVEPSTSGGSTAIGRKRKRPFDLEENDDLGFRQQIPETNKLEKLLPGTNEEVNNRTRKRPLDYDLRLQESEELQEMEQPLPEVKNEEIDRLVMFGDTLNYDVAGTSGVVHQPPSGNITVNRGEAPFVLQQNVNLLEPKQEVIEETPLEPKREEIDRLVFFGGHVHSEDEAGPSGVEEDRLPNTEFYQTLKAPDLLVEDDVAASAFALFDKTSSTSGASNEITVNPSTGISDLQCSVCYTFFASRVALYKHLCTPSGEVQFPCDTCDAVFPLIGDLQAHLATHGVYDPHICDECGSIFKHSHSLESHKMTHTGLRPFVCKLCGESFPNKPCLRSHMKVHPDRKRKRGGHYACDYCKYKSLRIPCIRHHLQQKHSDLMQQNILEAPENSVAYSLRRKKTKEVQAEPGFKFIKF